MRVDEVLDVLASKGADVLLDGDAVILTVEDPARLTAEDRALYREHREAIRAVLTLRVIHRSMGFSEEDVMLIESAILSGREIRIASLPPVGMVA